jgi:hypothetical protein
MGIRNPGRLVKVAVARQTDRLMDTERQTDGRRRQAGRQADGRTGGKQTDRLRFNASHTGGILRNVSDSVVALDIASGAHHLDLMFSHPDDPQSVVEARAAEVDHIALWIEGYAGT